MAITTDEALRQLMNEVAEYSNEKYTGKSVSEIFVITAAEEASSEDTKLKFFHDLCFRFVLDQYLIRTMEVNLALKNEVGELKQELKKMAQIIDILNQDGASK